MSKWLELQNNVLKVLSQPIGCGGVERVWSTFGWIQSKLRNRLLPENARKIVMSHMWLRLEQMRQKDNWEADMHVGATGPGLALARGNLSLSRCWLLQ